MSGIYNSCYCYVNGLIMKMFNFHTENVGKPTITCQMSPDSSSKMSAVLLCIEDLSQAPSPLEFEWISGGKVQPGKRLTISLGGELDKQQYICQVSNPLSQENATFTAKDCDTGKISPQSSPLHRTARLI